MKEGAAAGMKESKRINAEFRVLQTVLRPDVGLRSLTCVFLQFFLVVSSFVKVLHVLIG